MDIDGRATYGQLRKIKLMMEFVGGFAQNDGSGPSHFRSDTIARQQHDRLFHARSRIKEIEHPLRERRSDRWRRSFGR